MKKQLVIIGILALLVSVGFSLNRVTASSRLNY